MTQRKQQRESVLLKAIQEVFSRGFADPRIRGLITVTGIKLSDDGKHANVLISVLPEDKQDLTMHGLRAAGARIRKDAMGRVRLRDMPVLEFVVDGSIKQQGELLDAINRASEASGGIGDADEQLATGDEAAGFSENINTKPTPMDGTPGQDSDEGPHP